MKFYMITTEGWRWATVDDGHLRQLTSGNSTMGVASRVQEAFQFIHSAANLIVLAGLGTSLCVNKGKSAEGKKAPTLKDLWDQCAGLKEFQHCKTIVKFDDILSQEDIEGVLVRIGSYLQAFPNDKEIMSSFDVIIRKISNACDFVAWDDDLVFHRKFLASISHGRSRQGLTRPCIFTTNYDLCFEIAAAQAGINVVDGFTHGFMPRYRSELLASDVVAEHQGGPEKLGDVVKITKLHGSIDWAFSDGHLQRNWKSADDPLMIYPDGDKVGKAMTHEIFSAFHYSFRDKVKAPNTCVLISGFGYRDENVSSILRDAFQTNQSLSVVLVDPNFSALEKNSTFSLLKSQKEDQEAARYFFASTFEEFSNLYSGWTFK